ncbi:MAG: hypothetical protein K0S39_609 [Paenibacillus sp.]|jgi:uncharacterized membrane protein YfcA|nr:hypothetical protein [Paenibacillus sp.]
MLSEVVTIVLGGAIILFAGFVQGVTGFGFALIAVPLLSKIIPLQSVVPIIVLFSFFTNIVILLKSKAYVQFKRIWLLTVSSIFAAPLGTYILVAVRPDLIKIISGIVITGFAFILLKGYKFAVKNEKTALIPVGFTSGLLNGSISFSGPPVVLFLSNQGVDKNVFRANLTAYSSILNLVTLGFFFAGGLMNREVLVFSVWFVAAMLVGVLLGIKAVTVINDSLFRKLTLILIIIAGVWTLLSGL